jgi:hypothetical protein
MGMDFGRPLLETLIAIVDHDKPEFSPEFFAGLSLADRSCLQTAGILSDGEPYESMWVETADGYVEASVVVDPCITPRMARQRCRRMQCDGRWSMVIGSHLG